MTAEQLAKADSDSQSQTGTNQNTQNDANSQTEEKQPQEVPSQPVSPTVTLPTTAGQPAEIVTLHAQPKQQTVAANNQLINLTPTSINGQKQKAADQQAALPQTGNDEDLALLLLGSSLMAATGLTIIDRKRKHA